MNRELKQLIDIVNEGGDVQRMLYSINIRINDKLYDVENNIMNCDVVGDRWLYVHLFNNDVDIINILSKEKDITLEILLADRQGVVTYKDNIKVKFLGQREQFLDYNPQERDYGLFFEVL